jgi:hypothetical protein
MFTGKGGVREERKREVEGEGEERRGKRGR